MIMPFSETHSCTEDEWTQVFEDVIKPAVEAARYSCRRSTATRGNLIKGIIQDLDESWVVLADLTDRNPNVFYELGVRHALKDRTILVAQNRDDIPFDLYSYANHVYEWRTPQGKEQFTERIKALLEDVDKDPNRSDNPVSDFLGTPARQDKPPAVTSRLDDIEGRLDSTEAAFQLFARDRRPSSDSDTALSALRDASPLDQGTPVASWFDVGVEIAASGNSRALRQIIVRTKRDIGRIIPPKIQQLNILSSGGTIKRDRIPTEALKFETEFAPLASNIEQLALGLVSVDWPQGARALLEIAGSLISVGEQQHGGIRFAVGLPAFFAWRMLLFCGAHSVQEETFAVTSTLINSPIPVVRLGGQLSFLPLIKHRDLFYPEALLGYADLGIKHIGSEYARSEHIHGAFASDEEFQMSLAEFLILVALRDAAGEDRPLYPGYRLLSGFRSGCDRLVSRLIADPDRLTAIAQVFNCTGPQLMEMWPKLAEKANGAELGSEYWVDGTIPTTLGRGQE